MNQLVDNARTAAVSDTIDAAPENHVFGAVFESRAGVPLAAVSWGVFATVLLALAGLTGEPQVALLALLPLAWALGTLCFRPSGCQLIVTPTALEVGLPPLRIPLEHIQVVRWEGRTCRPEDLPFGPGRLSLVHEGGLLELPHLHSETAKVEDLYRFLWSFLTGSGSRRVSPRLARFVSEQEALHGSDKVFTFVAREHAGTRPPLRRLQASLALSGLVGIVWLLVGPLVGAHELFRLGGWALAVGGPVAALALWAASLPAVRMGHAVQDASLAIGPGGLALVQGSIEGVMEWDELLAVNGPHTLLGLGPDTALRLRVAGATIFIPDVYDRPLIVIRQKLYQCWRSAPRRWA